MRVLTKFGRRLVEESSLAGARKTGGKVQKALAASECPAHLLKGDYFRAAFEQGFGQMRIAVGHVRRVMEHSPAPRAKKSESQ